MKIEAGLRSIFLICLCSAGQAYEWRIGDAFIVEANIVETPSDVLPPLKFLKKSPGSVTGDLASGSAEETTTAASEAAGSTEPVTGNESYNPEAGSATQLPIPDGRKIYPWLAAISRNGEQFCTGSLIDNRHVLTTAYCIYNLTSEELADVEIDIGLQTATDCPFVTEKVSKAIRHLRFNPSTAYNDIGILQLLTPIKFGEFIQPISLTEDASVPDNETLEQSLIGWRATTDLHGEKFLAWRDQPVRSKSPETCRQNYATVLAPHGISDQMICRGGESSGTACGWQFGAPLVLKEDGDEVRVRATQVGIFSWGVEALLPQCMFTEEKPSPLVFTRVSSYYKWIITNLIH